MTTVVSPHSLILTHGREVKFDQAPDGTWRVAFYWPKGETAYLRKLAAAANRGDGGALRQLRELPQNRSGATHKYFDQALFEAIRVYDERRARALTAEVVRFATYVGWFTPGQNGPDAEPGTMRGPGDLPDDF